VDGGKLAEALLGNALGYRHSAWSLGVCFTASFDFKNLNNPINRLVRK
jgi:hypothetical protein